MTPEPPSPSNQYASLILISLAAFACVAAGAVFFRNNAPDVNVSVGQKEHRDEPQPPTPKPHAVMETQIARKAPAALQNDGSHCFTVFNAGNAVLKMAPGQQTEGMSVREYPQELSAGQIAYVIVAWSRRRDDAPRPWRGWVKVLTNDPQNQEFVFVIAEDSADATAANSNP
jgi:hypothetical protein